MSGKRSVDSSELVNNTAAFVAFAVDAWTSEHSHSSGLMDAAKSIVSSLVLDAAA